jgi:SAM-dependent methyltransferase
MEAVMDIRDYNRRAWNRQVEEGNRWTLGVSPDEIGRARGGDWTVLLTASKPVPSAWFPPMQGLDVLCLASAGGQQGPIFAAAGANVTVYDNSPRQLAQDRKVANRERLKIVTLEGDMRDLSAFSDASFDLVFHPVSNLFVPQVRPVWREASRVLRPGGRLLAGFMNPAMYIFDINLLDEQGIFQVRHALPYSDIENLTEAELKYHMERGWPLEWSHSLEDQLGGQIQAGFILGGLYEDRDPNMNISKYMPVYIATLAFKPQAPGI